MQPDRSEWEAFNRAALERPVRELLRRAVGLFEVTGRPPGTAVDLGAGSGADTLELLRRGWTVHAVDRDRASLGMLLDRVPGEVRDRLVIEPVAFQDFQFPRCQLVWASYSIPFCPRSDWPDLAERIFESLAPGGRFAGDFFGSRHAFATYGDVMVLTEEEVRAGLERYELEAFDIEDGVRPSGGQVTRWHAFGVTARKREV